MTQALVFMNYGLVLIYGAMLSVDFTGGCRTKKERNIVGAYCLLVLTAQTACAFFLGFETTRKLYPFITHLPLVLVLVKSLKRSFGASLISVLTAYFCCQLPRWFGSFIQFVFESELAYNAGYIISLFPFYFLLRRYLVLPLNQAITYTRHAHILFAILPLSYYIFDYATTVYTEILYEADRAVMDFLPAIMVLFYIVYISIYHKEMQKLNQLELDKITLTFQFQQARNEISTLRQTQQQSVNYRHDLRHHINLIYSLLEEGQIEKTMEYLSQVRADVERITPLHFCKNETANLIFSYFSEKAKQRDISLVIRADLPEELYLPDTELCAILSNGLENALQAADAVTGEKLRKVYANCRVERNMLLLEIENTYEGAVQMKDDLPVSTEKGHGYGCHSMRSIAEKRSGFCTFKAADGIFTLRVVLPLEKAM